MNRLWNQVKEFSTAIKISHSIFALPFALSALFIACDGVPPIGLLGKVVLACVLARTAAMTFNRLVDADIDATNPRTADRAVPAGRLSKRFMVVATVLCCLGFVATAAWIGRLAFILSPVVVIVLLGYSFTKRFTSLSHLVLGIALGLSPLGAWIAADVPIELAPVLLGFAIVFWTSGFDVIYACQDTEFDRQRGLHSIPSQLGARRALLLARIFHILAVGFLVAVGGARHLGWWYAVGVAVVAALLVYEHAIVRADDLSRVNVAFFTLNGLVSLAFLASVILDVVV